MPTPSSSSTRRVPPKPSSSNGQGRSPCSSGTPSSRASRNWRWCPSQLSAFVAREQVDPPGPLGSDGVYEVAPPGYRPYYCLLTVSRSRNPKLALPAGTDFCHTSLGPQFLRSRDSGQALYVPYKTGNTEELGLGTAIYQGGIVPNTVAGRRASLIGWTGIEFTPGLVLSAARAGHPSTAVLFRFQGPGRVTFSAGSAPGSTQAATIDLHNGWLVRVVGADRGGALFSNETALAVLLGGIPFFLLLGALIYVLGTSRSRALVLVDERTNELHHQAYHDSLTGLPNRSLIHDRIDRMVMQTTREPLLVAVLFLDLDNFKDINDTLGHRIGDELLAAVGNRLSALLRGSDTVGRLGGDEFVIVMGGSASASDAELLADRVLQSLEFPFDLCGTSAPIAVTASIGIAVGEGNGAGAAELLRDADIALYHAKAAGKHRFAVYCEAMRQSMDDRHQLDLELHTALHAGQFFLQYQPTHDLSTDEVVGVEALLRWRHPTKGVLAPNTFVPSLESSGLIIPVGRWALETACRQGAKWHALGHRIAVSVNVSAGQLQRDRIVDDVTRALSCSGFDPSMLVLELTESTLMRSPSETIDRLILIKDLGVRLAIDDFGTGFSSLAYLQMFPTDILKVDRSFVSGLADTLKSSAILKTFVQLGRALGLQVIAEGIETEDQRHQLVRLGVDVGQGFLFSRPLDGEAILPLLDAAVEPIQAVNPGGFRT